MYEECGSHANTMFAINVLKMVMIHEVAVTKALRHQTLYMLIYI